MKAIVSTLVLLVGFSTTALAAGPQDQPGADQRQVSPGPPQYPPAHHNIRRVRQTTVEAATKSAAPHNCPISCERTIELSPPIRAGSFWCAMTAPSFVAIFSCARAAISAGGW